MQWLLVALGILVVGGIAALVCARNAGLSTAVGFFGAVAGCVAGLVGLADIFSSGGERSYVAAWDVPYGSFSLEVDPLSAFFALPILILAPLGALFALGYLPGFSNRRSQGSIWFFYNLLVAGMLVVVLARNGMLFLVAWEVMSLAAFFLITSDNDKQEVRDAGRTFLIATNLSTAALLVMFALLSTNGSLDFADFAQRPGTTSASVIFFLALLGFGTKAGIMPLHVWLPESYPVAPSFVSAVMSGAMSKLGIYGLLRILLLSGESQLWWGWLLVGLGAISAVLGILSALVEGDLKRLLAYSSIENIGIISMGIGLGIVGMTTESPLLGALAFAGALFHVWNHAMFKGLLFMGAGVVTQAAGTRELNRLGGLLKQMPWTGAAFFIGSVAIAGLPPLNGFASEFLLYSASLGGEGLLGTPSTSILSLAVTGALALAGGLAAFCFAKAFGIAFLGQPRTPQAGAAIKPTAIVVVPLILLAVSCLGVGLLAPKVVETLMPVVAQIMHASAVEQVVSAFDPLDKIAQMSLALVVLVGVLAVVRRMLLAGRTVAASGTWGCGYSRPTSRIQYTASSFAQPAIEFFATFVRSRRTLSAPTGLFPRSASLRTQDGDLSRDLIYGPLFDTIGLALSKLRWLQHGRVHLYILYVGCTILALMIWYASVELAPQSEARAEAVVESAP